jgi:glycosyltransferase involved in cell wall biosynthesis
MARKFNMTSPLLSIITVVYNNKKGLEFTLKNILNQTFKDYELIIIDGASTDGTVGLIKQSEPYISYWISEKDKGIYDAMNKGIQAAKGQWITFMNSDDCYFSSQSLFDIFNRSLETYDFIYTDMFLCDDHGKKIRSIPAEPLSKWSITKGMIACHQGMFIRRQLCPLYSDYYKGQGDLNWVTDILHNISKNRLLHIPIHSVYFKAGGFSDQSIALQLREHLHLIYKRYGILMILYRIPRLCRRYLGKFIRRSLGIQTFRFWVKH